MDCSLGERGVVSVLLSKVSHNVVMTTRNWASTGPNWMAACSVFNHCPVFKHQIIEPCPGSSEVLNQKHSAEHV